MSKNSNICTFILQFIIGIVLGIIAKFTDGRDFLYYFPVFADIMGRFGIWVWVAALIAIRSKNLYSRQSVVLSFLSECYLHIMDILSFFCIFSKITNDFVGRHHYGYSVLWFSDVAYTQRKSLCKFHFFLTFYNFLYRMVFNSFYCSGLGFPYCQR